MQQILKGWFPEVMVGGGEEQLAYWLIVMTKDLKRDVILHYIKIITEEMCRMFSTYRRLPKVSSHGWAVFPKN